MWQVIHVIYLICIQFFKHRSNQRTHKDTNVTTFLKYELMLRIIFKVYPSIITEFISNLALSNQDKAVKVKYDTISPIRGT